MLSLTRKETKTKHYAVRRLYAEQLEVDSSYPIVTQNLEGVLLVAHALQLKCATARKILSGVIRTLTLMSLVNLVFSLPPGTRWTVNTTADIV